MNDIFTIWKNNIKKLMLMIYYDRFILLNLCCYNNIMDKRPIFYYKDNKQNEIKAGGIVFYRYGSNGKIKLLVMYSNKYYKDFGGKTDINDKNIKDTVSRETEEESNGIFTQEILLKKYFDKKKYIELYNKQSKYMVYLIKIKKKYKPADFGDVEIYENIPRKALWLTPEKLKSKIHVRLNFKEFIDTINNL